MDVQRHNIGRFMWHESGHSVNLNSVIHCTSVSTLLLLTIN